MSWQRRPSPSRPGAQRHSLGLSAPPQLENAEQTTSPQVTPGSAPSVEPSPVGGSSAAPGPEPPLSSPVGASPPVPPVPPVSLGRPLAPAAAAGSCGNGARSDPEHACAPQ